jgi:hypothetical protein
MFALGTSRTSATASSGEISVGGFGDDKGVLMRSTRTPPPRPQTAPAIAGSAANVLTPEDVQVASLRA